MIESEEHSSSIAEQKARIRERYKGIDSTELDVIPALPQENFYEDTKEKRVAVYARVSTDDPRQTSSYELQKNHYLDVVGHHEGWKLVDIYADEGISGTSLQHRDSFVRMISDCNAGRIDLIVTKGVSRFARNVLDCIGYVRKLAAMQPPIGVFFETENIFTLNSNSEMSLSFISTLAQEESHNKSEIMNASVEMRFRRGIFLTPPLLGYDIDEDGNLVINSEEAKTVRLIFFMYLYGYSCTQIADTLTQLGRQTKKGNTVWFSGSVIQILQNERHCGDVLARKTWTPSYLDHKSKKNRQDRNQYRQKNHHEAIVSRDDFIAVQRMLSNAKYQINIEKHMIPYIGEVKLNRLTPRDIQRLYETLLASGLSGNSARHVHNNLHRALLWAVKQELIPRNPADMVDPPLIEQKERTTLTPEQIPRLLTACEGEFIYLPVMLAVSLGLRRGEALGLQWDDIDFIRKTVSIRHSVTCDKAGFTLGKTKTKSSNRTLMLPDVLTAALKKEEEKQATRAKFIGCSFNPLNLVCCRDDGSPITTNALQHQFSDTLKIAELPHIRFHDLRHTFATLSLKSGVDVKTLSGALGHYSAGFTLNTYTHATAQMKQDAADAIGGVISQQMR